MTEQFRTEKDSMGEFQVPINAKYGASTARAVENFPISNLRFSRSFIKAIGDIYDDSHIYTASEGAFCGIFYEGSENSLREVFIKSIKQSSLKRILWISNHKETGEITELDNLTYICLLYTSPSPRDRQKSRMPSSA